MQDRTSTDPAVEQTTINHDKAQQIYQWLSQLDLPTKTSRPQTRTLPEGYLPRTPALWATAVFLAEGEGRNRKWRHNLRRRLRTLAHLHRPPTTQAYSWLRQAVSASETSVCQDLINLEKAGLLRCSQHGNPQGIIQAVTNRWEVPPTEDPVLVQIDRLVSLLPAAPDPNGSSRTHSPLDQSPRPHLFVHHGDQVPTDSWQRRQQSARTGTMPTPAARVAPEPADAGPISTGRQAGSWAACRARRDVIWACKALIERKAPTLIIDRDFLELQEAHHRQLSLSGPVDRRRWHACEADIAFDLLQHGMPGRYNSAATGRYLCRRLASPLTASTRPGRRGCSFWRALRRGQPLHGYDLVMGDVLSMAILSGDRVLWEDWLGRDLYTEGAIELGLLPPGHALEKSSAVRRLLKVWTLAAFYGAAAGALAMAAVDSGSVPDAEEAEDLARRYTRFLRHRYRRFFSWFRGQAHYARQYAQLNRSRYLWTGLPFRPKSVPDRVTGQLVPAFHTAGCHQAQSLTTYVNAALAVEVERRGGDVVATIHDSVVTRRPMPVDELNGIVAAVVSDLLEERGLDWSIPPGARFVEDDSAGYEQLLAADALADAA